MRKLLLCGITMALILAMTGPVVALEVSNETPVRWSDIGADFVAGPPGPPNRPSAPTGGLTFYVDRATFQAENPSLVFEDYSGTNVPPNSVDSCLSPFNDESNDACFSPGAIVDGVSVDSTPSAENVILTTGFIGVTCNAVGPNFFADDGTITFDDPAVPVYAVGLDFVCPTALTANINIYDVGGVLLGTDSVNCDIAGDFWGVASDDQLGWIETVDPQAAGELYCDVEFGMGAVPTVPEWGLILLVTILLGISTLFVYRRRSV